MFEFQFLQVVWWMVMGIMLVVYASTAGFDLGITIMMPFMRREEDRRVLLNISAPTWDGNQTWLVFIGGGLFVIWPVVYATAFSGLYFAMMCILWSFFLRPPGYDYRGKLPSHCWRRMWDWALFISSFLPVLVFGVAFGNALEGYPFFFDPITMRDFYQGSIWDLFSWFGVLAGVTSVLMILMHASAYIYRRTEGKLSEHYRKLHVLFAILLLIFLGILASMVVHSIHGYVLIHSPLHATDHPLENVVVRRVGGWVSGFVQYPWKFYAPALAIVGIIISLWANFIRWKTTTFWASVFAVAGVVGSAGFTLFPFIMPSSVHPNESITVWNGTSTQYALNVMLYIGVVLLMIILAYKIFAYWATWNKKETLNAADLQEQDKHIFY